MKIIKTFLTLAVLWPMTSLPAEGQSCAAFGSAGDIPVVGDWNGDGLDEIGVFNNANWKVDYNGNGVWDGPGIDRLWVWGLAGDDPVVGDWNGDGRDQIGIFRNAHFHLDYNGNAAWDGCSADQCSVFGLAGDHPVSGDWDGDGRDQIGIFRLWLWDIDLNGNFEWDGPPADRATVFGLEGDYAVAGDWDGDGRDEIAVYRPSVWSLDLNDNGLWDGLGTDDALNWGVGAHTPITGDWDGDGTDQAGMFLDGSWFWEGCTVPPVAVDDSATVSAGSAVEIRVTANDYDPDGSLVVLAQSPNPVIQQPANGTATRSNDEYIRYTPDPGFSGTDSFHYQVTDGDGLTASAQVSVTVSSLPGPDVTLVTRRTIPLGQQTTVSVRGRHMGNAVVHIAEPASSSQVAPTLISSTIAPASTQHRIDLVLDTSDPRTEGTFAIIVENGAGPEMAAVEDVRVVPNHPVVDVYTPAVAAESSAYVLMAAGSNLRNAAVQASHPSVTITQLDTSDDEMISGLMIVEGGASPGNFNLNLTAPGGGTLQLPIELPDDLQEQVGRSGVNLNAGRKGLPALYFQPLKFTDEVTNQPLVKKAAGLIGAKAPTPCSFQVPLYRLRHLAGSFSLAFGLLNSSGDFDPTVLSGMVVEETRRLTMAGVIVYGSLGVSIDVNYCVTTGVIEFDTCFEGVFGTELIGGPGLVAEFRRCAVGPNTTQYRTTHGTLSDFQFSSAGNCTQLSSAGIPGQLAGQQAVDVEVTGCCEENILVSLVGTAFNGSGLNSDYNLSDFFLVRVVPDCEPQVYDIEIRAFIPVNHVSAFPLTCSGFILGPLDIVFRGDDRGFDPNPPLDIFSTNPFRLSHEISVVPDAAECSEIPGCTSEGLSSSVTKIGRTEAYAENALFNPPVSVINHADRDGVGNDCNLWLEDDHSTPELNQVSVERLGPEIVSVKSRMGAADPLAPGAPNIDWDFELIVTTAENYLITGIHDCYPGYEVYVNDKWVWGYMPAVHFPSYLACCLSGIRQITYVCTGSLNDPSLASRGTARPVPRLRSLGAADSRASNRSLINRRVA